MSIYLIERTTDRYDELTMHPQNTIYYSVREDYSIGDCCDMLNLDRETYFAITQLTKENFIDVINKISESSDREEVLASILELVKW